ncbi:tetratricopeptide repeat protein [Patescibacteria group bacterium]|nr:tetratricopeptide repeat protein [Patescibacteria group bacterium]
MSLPSFGYAARLQAQTGESFIVQLAGTVFFWGMLVASLFWWNGLFDPHEAPKQVLFGLVMILVASLTSFAAYRQKAARPFSWALMGGLVAITVSVAISGFVAPDHWTALFGVAGSISTAGFTWLTAISACITAGSLYVLGWRPKVTGGYVAFMAVMILGWAQRLGWVDVSPGGLAARIFSPLGNEVAGAWLIACVAIGAFAKECLGDATQKQEIIRKLFLALSAITIFAIDQTAIWVMLLIGLLVIAAVLQKSLLEKKAAVIGWVMACVLAVVGLVWTVPQPYGLPQLATLTSSQSWETVQAAWHTRGMLFGAGLGQWSAVFETIRPVAFNAGSLFSIRFDAGGSFWWTLLLQQGVVGGVLWVLFLGILFLQTILRLREDEERLPLAIGAWMALLAGFITQPHGWGLVLLFAVFGFLLADEYETGESTRIIWSVALLGPVLLMLIGLPSLTRRLLADSLLHDAQNTSNVAQRHEMTNRAADTAPWLIDESFAATEADAAWLTERLQHATGNTADLQQALSAAISRSKAATARWPQSPEMWLAQGSLYAALAPITQGADQFAIQAYQQGMAFAPRHPGFPLGMAEVFLQRAASLQQQAQHAKAADQKSLGQARLEQLRLAAQWFKRALELKPDDRSVRYAYASTLARAGDVSGARPLFASLVQEDPSRSDLVLEYATILAELNQRSEAIAFAQRIGSRDQQFMSAQRLLVVWCEAEHRYADALAAIRNFPLQEQQTNAVRQRINRLQSLVSASTAR